MDDCAGLVRQCIPSHLVDDIYDGRIHVPREWAGMLKRHELGDGIAVGCVDGYASAEWAVRAESPPTFCIAVMLDGRLRTALDGGAVLDFRAGMVSILSSGATTSGWNRFAGHSGFRMVDIRLTPQALERLTGQSVIPLCGRLLHDCSLPGLNAFMGCTPASVGLIRVARDILACQLQSDIARCVYLRAKALEALAIVLDRIAMGNDLRPLQVSGDRRRLLQAKALLESSCGEDWTLPVLSRAVGLNQKRLQSGFRALFGDSVHTCLSRIRVDVAASLLQGGISVTEVAGRVGFSSLSHFCRFFRAHMGVSPKQYAMGGAGGWHQVGEGGQLHSVFEGSAGPEE